MKNTKYNHIADLHKPKENRLIHIFISFLSGGFLGLVGEGLVEFFVSYFSLSRTDASTFMILVFIFMASLLTGLGVFDKLVSIFRCGLLIPITGFAHSMASCALDYRNEGPIYGIGSNMFKLAGSVIVYGIVSAWFFGTIRYLIEVFFL
ncbi:MAG: SpoVA/SpoVAEb family sporulation membrane protein [Bacilli bacterium]|nr:SpoVA/SpoVAEb family sporulation membrane protein [Bacilli bacterium]